MADATDDRITFTMKHFESYLELISVKFLNLEGFHMWDSHIDICIYVV